MKPIVRVAMLLGVALSCATPACAEEAQPAPSTDVSGRGGTLSDKLDQTGGVIHPQGAVDPKIDKGAPDTGRMPVIPPAGAPGGAPDAQPK